MMRQAVHEAVLYYTPDQTANTVRLKGVLVRMGIRIKNVRPDQVQETVGSLLGIPGYEKAGDQKAEEAESQNQDIALAEIGEEMLVLHKFSDRRLDELLMNLRKAGVPKIALKAVVTESNAGWTFYHLYQEIREEHEKMSAQE